MRVFISLAALVAVADGHGAMVLPRSRNSVDVSLTFRITARRPNHAHYSFGPVPSQQYLVRHNEGGKCSNLTGDACNNGQAAMWYSQGEPDFPGSASPLP